MSEVCPACKKQGEFILRYNPKRYLVTESAWGCTSKEVPAFMRHICPTCEYSYTTQDVP